MEVNETIVTRTKSDIVRALYLIEESKEPLEVRIRSLAATRSDAQNALAFKWYQEAERQLKDGVSQRAYCKLHFGVGILKAGDSAICKHFTEQYDAIVKPLAYELKMQSMLPPFELPVTKLMTIKQFTEYLRMMEQHYSTIGVALSHPDDLYWAAVLGGSKQTI